MKLHQLAVATILASAAMAANAEFTVSPMVGYHMFDNDFGLEDGTTTGSMALGYRVNPNVGLEARFGQTQAEANDGTGLDARFQNTTLDAYYRFNTANNFQPYVLIGGGQTRVKIENGGLQNGSFDTTIVNAAVGAFYQLANNLSLRAELRGVQYVENAAQNNVDGIASVGVLYAFGGTKAAAPVAAAPYVAAPVAAVAVDGDDDKDGVTNSVDKCPGTPTTVVVDANGCPKMLTETVTKEIRVLFDTNKSIVKPAFNAEIEGVAKLMKEYPTAKVEVQGHTDSRGSAQLNDRLSQDRANAVAAVLTDKYGIASDRISAKGYGAGQPVADNKTVEGQTKNRRVIAVAQGEVKVIIKK